MRPRWLTPRFVYGITLILSWWVVVYDIAAIFTRGDLRITWLCSGPAVAGTAMAWRGHRDGALIGALAWLLFFVGFTLMVWTPESMLLTVLTLLPLAGCLGLLWAYFNHPPAGEGPR